MTFSGVTFAHGLLTKYHAAFGNIFSDITIKRQSTDGTINQQFIVPLHWGPKEKMLARVEALPDADRQVAVQLPVISYEFIKPVYDVDRKSITVARNVKKIANTSDPQAKLKFLVQYQPVPYILMYNVYVYAKSIEDGNRIAEQIMAFFPPDFTISMLLIPEMNDERDVQITLNDVSFDDIGKEDSPLERRVLIWTFQFSMKAFFFGPVMRKPMIKDIIMNYRIDGRRVNPEDKEFPNFNDPNLDDSSPIVSSTEQYPGVTANGQPTTNASAAIDWKLVDVDDEWAIVIQKRNIQPSNSTMANTSTLPVSNT